MNGLIDDELRALVKVKVGVPGGSITKEITVWITRRLESRERVPFCKHQIPRPTVSVPHDRFR